MEITEEMIQKIGRYVKFYKEERPHSSLEWNTPQSVYESNGKILKKEMIVTLILNGIMFLFIMFVM